MDFVYVYEIEDFVFVHIFWCVYVELDKGSKSVSLVLTEWNWNYACVHRYGIIYLYVRLQEHKVLYEIKWMEKKRKSRYDWKESK